VRLLVHRVGVAAPEVLPVSSIADYVTERGNPNNERQVISVEVEVPTSLLQRGIRLIDTPGIGSTHQRNTETTYAFLPEADAVIFVTSVESPLTDTELTFLDSVRRYSQRTFVVLNKVDQVGAEDLDDVVRYTREVIRQRLGEDAPGLFALSAREALVAKRTGDVARLERSGLPAFETSLTSFLATARGKALLVGTLDRAWRILDEERQIVTLNRGPAPGGQEGTGGWPSASDEMVGRLTVERERLVERARAAASEWEAEVLEPILQEYVDAERSMVLAEVGSRTKAEADRSSRRERLREWWRQVLAERGRRFLLDRGRDWEAAARRILEVVADQPAASERAAHADLEAAAILRRAVPESPRPFALAPLAVAFTGAELGGDDLLLMVPPPFAGWAFRRQVRKDLAADLACLADRLREAVRGYLEAHVVSIEYDSTRVIEDLRSAEPEPIEAKGRPERWPAGGRAPLGRAEVDELPAIDRLIRRLEDLRSVVMSGEGPADAAPAVVPEGPTPGPTGEAAVEASGAAAAAAIEALLRADGCPICVDVEKGTFEFLAHWQYLLATDEAARGAHRAGGGFCREHSWALETVASPRGICAGYPPVTDRFAQEIAGAAGLPARTMAERLRRVTPSPTTCRLCAFQRQSEEAAAHRLASFLETEAGRREYAATHGLCLPHLVTILEAGVSDETAAFLVDVAARHLTDVSAAMRGFAVKIDARRRDLLTREEYQASRRALALLVGSRGGASAR